MGGVVIYGKQGAGKTMNARQLATFYGKSTVVDDDPRQWRPGNPVPDDTIVLTSVENVAGAVPLEEALRLLGDGHFHE